METRSKSDVVVRSKEKMTADGRIGGRKGAPIANHNRWHVNRNIQNSECKLCIQEKQFAA
jgi:hypothetical protein